MRPSVSLVNYPKEPDTVIYQPGRNPEFTVTHHTNAMERLLEANKMNLVQGKQKFPDFDEPLSAEDFLKAQIQKYRNILANPLPTSLPTIGLRAQTRFEEDLRKLLEQNQYLTAAVSQARTKHNHKAERMEQSFTQEIHEMKRKHPHSHFFAENLKKLKEMNDNPEKQELAIASLIAHVVDRKPTPSSPAECNDYLSSIADLTLIDNIKTDNVNYVGNRLYQLTREGFTNGEGLLNGHWQFFKDHDFNQVAHNLEKLAYLAINTYLGGHNVKLGVPSEAEEIGQSFKLNSQDLSQILINLHEIYKKEGNLNPAPKLLEKAQDSGRSDSSKQLHQRTQEKGRELQKT